MALIDVPLLSGYIVEDNSLSKVSFFKAMWQIVPGKHHNGFVVGAIEGQANGGSRKNMLKLQHRLWQMHRSDFKENTSHEKCAF